ncbi:MAG TPA: hypothetical protein DDY29_09415 [Rhodobacteraceae bacterium]|nr:hypothetical protein [Paracoccaceae bacterium]
MIEFRGRKRRLQWAGTNPVPEGGLHMADRRRPKPVHVRPYIRFRCKRREHVRAHSRSWPSR